MAKQANLLYVFDDGFAECATVSICSFLENNKWQSYTNIWVFDDGISDTNKKRINAMISRYDCKIRYISTKNLNNIFCNAKLDTWRGRYYAYIKLFINELSSFSISSKNNI